MHLLGVAKARTPKLSRFWTSTKNMTSLLTAAFLTSLAGVILILDDRRIGVLFLAGGLWCVIGAVAAI